MTREQLKTSKTLNGDKTLNPSCALIIPARYASSRYPGKPLALIKGKSLIHHTIEAGLAAQKELSNCLGVFVATDDERIQQHVNSLNLSVTVIMTSSACENGTERTAETYQHLTTMGINPDIIINLQGDSLLTPVRFITALVTTMETDSSIMVSTPALRCDQQTLQNFQEDAAAGRVGGTTMTMTKQNDALYFSKAIIPYIDPKVSFESDADIPVFHHVGLYGYRPTALQNYHTLSYGPCETYEKLEQLRFLENGYAIRCVIVEAKGDVFWEVNNPEDIARVTPYLR